MIKDRTANIIINALKPFKLTLEYLSCEKKDGQANFVFRLKEKIKAEKLVSFADDIRMRLACRENVKIKGTSEDTVCVILPEEFAEEDVEKKEQIEASEENSPLNEAIKTIKEELKEGKTSDMLTLMKALDSKYDKYDKQVKLLEENDDYLKVLEYAVKKGTISISEVQRKFQIGYIRAGRYIDDFENKGYISSSEGSKKRKVIITEEEFKAKYKK